MSQIGEESHTPPPPPPPRAFSQGVGTVFQFVGVLMFLTMFFVCCGSSLLSKDWAMRTDLTHVGWHRAGDPPQSPTYSAQKALTISVFAGVFFGLAMAGVGLGLQAEYTGAAFGAIAISLLGTVFWIMQTIFAATQARSILFTLLAGGLGLIFVLLLALSVNALRDIRRNPPPRGHEILPADYKVPYSHYHPDPPEVRLAAELQQRRERLVVQQKELEMLEEKLKRRVDQSENQP